MSTRVRKLNKMRDDIEFNITFCEIVEKNPSIYDHTRHDYCNINVQDKIWQEIGRELKESAKDCKQRWQNIRGRYSKFKKAQSLPSGSEAKITKEYYLAPHLRFLDGFLKSRKPKGNIQKNNDSDSESERSVYSSNTTASPMGSELSGSAKPQKRTLNDVNDVAYEYFNRKNKYSSTVSTLASSENPIDPDLLFLQSVLPDMKLMTFNQKRNFKIGILNLCNKILNEKSYDTQQTNQPYHQVNPQKTNEGNISPFSPNSPATPGQSPLNRQLPRYDTQELYAQQTDLEFQNRQDNEQQYTRVQYAQQTDQPNYQVNPQKTNEGNIPPFSPISPATPGQSPLNRVTHIMLNNFYEDS